MSAISHDIVNHACWLSRVLEAAGRDPVTVADKIADSWSQTYTGIAYDLLDPRPDQVSVDDIAHHMAMECRFRGATKHHYSVAQHSIYVVQAVEEAFVREALVHDMAEFILGDRTTPMKWLDPTYKLLEERHLGVICQALDVPWPWSMHARAQVQHADLCVLAAERDQLLTTPPRPWGELPPPAAITIERWAPEYAERAFRALIYDILGK